MRNPSMRERFYVGVRLSDFSRLLIAACLITSLLSSKSEAAIRINDVVFATVDSKTLSLDLLLPENVVKPPLVIFIHGGSWSQMTRKQNIVPWLADHGFAVASIDYRLVPEAVFPSQVHDCKAAVRWLRAHAEEYGFDATRIGVAGESAGGHLAVMLGVTGDIKELEGSVGGNLNMSSRVQAIVDYYGPTDFILRSENQPEKTEKPGSPVHLLLGGPVKQNEGLARYASPAFHVTDNDAPLLIFHGDEDNKVLLDQSLRIVDEYRKANLEVTLEVVKGGRHGSKTDEPYSTPVNRQKVVDFLNARLR
ncbi:alpha/beta hydrolase fold domain-containing protein [Planctomicrobium sp. SH664]|uniref:alpha/beta hydrolase fold domain-containing protein n=1 Tax=Planctomicrobium sp. SH664 TaxID=3448125 RepID=UPI003F5BF9CF